MDLRADHEFPMMIEPGERVLVPTGLSLELPEGVEAQIRPRSGMALKHGITVLNSPGTIDSGYRGEVKVLLYNAGQIPFMLVVGERIAQMVIARHETVEWCLVEAISETERSAGGFGHTGNK
jgi:dUTP pyrophosphatase